MVFNLRDALIVAVDPGITTGMAILNAYGNVLDIYSKRDMTKAEIINRILKFGNPVVISCDVSTTPRSIEKIATKLGCTVYSPDTSLSIKEKKELTKDYYRSTKNDHEVDALSAAIKAWKQHRTLFSKVNDTLSKFDKQEIFSDIMLKILKEESPNIEDAVREFIEKKSDVATGKISKEDTTQRDVIGRMQKKVDEKQHEIDSLHNQNILLSKALNETRKELSRLKERGFEVDITKDYQELESSIHNLKKLRRIENKGYYPVVEIERVDGDLLERMNNSIDLEGRVILVAKTENLNLLNNLNIKCLITFDEIDQTENLEFPIVQIEKDALEISDDIKTIKTDYIEKRLADAKKLGLVGWLKGYRKRRD